MIAAMIFKYAILPISPFYLFLQDIRLPVRGLLDQPLPFAPISHPALLHVQHIIIHCIF